MEKENEIDNQKLQMTFENDQSMHKVKRFLNWEEWTKP